MFNRIVTQKRLDNLEKKIARLERIQCCASTEIFTILYEEDTGGTGDPDYFNNLIDLMIEPNQTIYFEGTFTINTSVEFFSSAQWALTDYYDSLTEWEFEYATVDGSEVGGYSDGFFFNPESGTFELRIKGSVTNNTGSTQNIRFQAWSYDSYFNTMNDNIFLQGSIFRYSLSPF